MKKSATKALEKELAEKFTKKGTVCLLNIALCFFFVFLQRKHDRANASI